MVFTAIFASQLLIAGILIFSGLVRVIKILIEKLVSDVDASLALAGAVPNTVIGNVEVKQANGH